MNKIILILFVTTLPQVLFAQSFLKTANDHIMKTGNIAASLKASYFKHLKAFDNKSQATEIINSPTLNVITGLGKRADFELNWDMFRFVTIPFASHVSSYTDIGDLSFFAKINIFSENILPSLNVRIGAKMPNASNERYTGTDLADTFAGVVSGKTIGSLHIFSNLGVEILGNTTTDGQDDALSYGLACSYSLFQHWLWSSEINGRYEKPLSNVNQSILKTGLTYLYRDWKFDLGISGRLLTQNSESFGITAGITNTFHAF